MAIVRNVGRSGSTRTSTLNGNIELNEGTGELLVRNGSHILTAVNSEGFTYAEQNGLRRIRIGRNPKDGSVGEWISKPTIDVIDELSS